MKIAYLRPMTHHHAVLWIDQHEAKIFHFDAESFDASTIESPHHHVRKHPQVTAERNHPADAQHYYHEVAQALEDVAEILVVGPSTAKLEFIKHVHKHDHGLEPKIVGVETVDHPTDGQLVAYARRYFRAADRMR
jgi:stalled ribosome rescue protein Dom34